MLVLVATISTIPTMIPYLTLFLNELKAVETSAVSARLMTFSSSNDDITKLREAKPHDMRDTAVFFNANSNKYGLVSTSSTNSSSQRINDVLNEIDTLWVISNWISIPKQQIILDTVREKNNAFGATKTVKLLITDSADYGSEFSEPGSSLNTCILTASQLLGADNVHIASRALVSGRDLSCFDEEDSSTTLCSTKTFLGDVNGTVLDYRNSDIVRHIHNGVIAKWGFCVRTEYLNIFDEIIREKLDLKKNAEVTAPDFSNYEKVRVKDVAYLMKVVTHQNNLTGLVGMVSEGGRTGRRTTSKLYASALLEHKVVAWFSWSTCGSACTATQQCMVSQQDFRAGHGLYHTEGTENNQPSS